MIRKALGRILFAQRYVEGDLMIGGGLTITGVKPVSRCDRCGRRWVRWQVLVALALLAALLLLPGCTWNSNRTTVECRCAGTVAY